MQNFLKCFVVLMPFITGFAQSVNYPLHPGDLWQYTLNIQRTVVKDTLMPNGLIYTMIANNGFQITTYQRQSGDSVFQYGWQSNQDELLYDFSRSPGDTVATYIYGTDTTDIILLWSGTGTVFGRNLRQWEFFIDTRHYFDEEEFHLISDSLGLTRWMDFWIQYDILGAIINGVVDGTIVKIDPAAERVPETFRLAQNYPNPFNPGTAISYQLPVPGAVELAVYNLLGQKIKTLVSEIQPTGFYRISWDGREAQGQNAASGLYIYRITVQALSTGAPGSAESKPGKPTFVQSRKMLLLK